MANWSNLHFFDKNGKAYNFSYDAADDKWTGNIYLPAVSVGLFELTFIKSIASDTALGLLPIINLAIVSHSEIKSSFLTILLYFYVE